jgi:hypothetical protein
MKSLLYVVLVVAGCASAERVEAVGGRPDGGPGGGGGSGTGKDADILPPVDAAPLPDAPPGQQQITLSQTNDQTLAVEKTVACGSSVGGIPLGTSDNSWYRVFKLSDHGVTGAFTVQRVTFYSDYAYAGTGTTQPATIKIGTYAGTLEADTLVPASITNITTQAITIPDANSADGIDPPVITDLTATIPAGSNLIVEVSLPNGVNDGNFFYIGVSAGGETKKGYIRATPAGCNMTSPKSLVSPTGLNKPDNAVMLTVTGTT